MKTDLKYCLIKSDREGLYRIQALKTFANVQKGDIGGYVSNPYNLSHKGTCWIYDNAIVRGNAKITDNAMIRGEAIIKDNAIISNNACVQGNTIVCNNAKVKDDSIIAGKAQIMNQSQVCDYGIVQDKAILLDNAKVCGRAVVDGDTVCRGYSVVTECSDIEEDIIEQLEEMAKKMQTHELVEENDTRKEKECYSYYQMDWMKNHGYTLEDIFKQLESGYNALCAVGEIDGETSCEEDIEALKRDFYEEGFNGEMFVGFYEFMDNEFLDKEYMDSILPDNLKEWYQNQIHQEPEKVKAGPINILDESQKTHDSIVKEMFEHPDKIMVHPTSPYVTVMESERFIVMPVLETEYPDAVKLLLDQGLLTPYLNQRHCTREEYKEYLDSGYEGTYSSYEIERDGKVPEKFHTLKGMKMEKKSLESYLERQKNRYQKLEKKAPDIGDDVLKEYISSEIKSMEARLKVLEEEIPNLTKELKEQDYLSDEQCKVIISVLEKKKLPLELVEYADVKVDAFYDIEEEYCMSLKEGLEIIKESLIKDDLLTTREWDVLQETFDVWIPEERQQTLNDLIADASVNDILVNVYSNRSDFTVSQSIEL